MVLEHRTLISQTLLSYSDSTLEAAKEKTYHFWGSLNVHLYFHKVMSDVIQNINFRQVSIHKCQEPCKVQIRHPQTGKICFYLGAD